VELAFAGRRRSPRALSEQIRQIEDHREADEDEREGEDQVPAIARRAFGLVVRDGPGGAQEAQCRDGDDRDAEPDQSKAGEPPEPLMVRDERLPRELRRYDARKRSNFSTRNPKAIMAMAVRTQARKVRSFAEWSLKRWITEVPAFRPAANALRRQPTART
jgi:hypothetical protein